jgi:hypothetical protein
MEKLVNAIAFCACFRSNEKVLFLFSRKGRAAFRAISRCYLSQISGFFPGISLFHVGVLPRCLDVAVKPRVLDGFERVILFWKEGGKIYNPIKKN